MDTRGNSASGNSSSVVKYPGYLLRQMLVDFCLESIEEFPTKMDELRKDMVTLHDAGNTLEEVEVYAELKKLMGMQLAFRQVCEWAREHNVPGEPNP